jgi:RNA polymerase sigma factor (sigma-70 family)
MIIDLDDNELVRMAKEEQSNEAFNELIERHSGIFVDTVSRYCPQNRKNFWMQEILEDKYSFFWDAISSFSNEKSQFHTWLANITKYKCKSKRTSENKKADKEFIDDLELDVNNIEDNKSIVHELEKKEICSIIDNVVKKKFCERDCKIFYERFQKERKLIDIADQFNLKPQRIEQIGKTILKEIKDTIS